MNARTHSTDVYKGLKTRAGTLVDTFGVGSLKIAESKTRVSKSAIERYYSQRCEDRDVHMPVDVVLDLEKATRSPVVTEYLALCQGYKLVQVPGAQGAADWLDHFADITRVHSALVAEFSEALRDGVIDRQEARRMLELLHDDMQRLGNLREALRSVATGEVV